ncbi:KIF3C [Symbiodinium sp. CCMP2592]|nr:KIF3C [Symbiodinium sp. CCMP2592]
MADGCDGYLGMATLSSATDYVTVRVVLMSGQDLGTFQRPGASTVRELLRLVFANEDAGLKKANLRSARLLLGEGVLEKNDLLSQKVPDGAVLQLLVLPRQHVVSILRCRPATAKEQSAGGGCKDVLKLEPQQGRARATLGEYSTEVALDLVYDESASTEAIFQDAVFDLVLGTLSGQSAAVLLRGASRTGKQHTLFAADGLLEQSFNLLQERLFGTLEKAAVSVEFFEVKGFSEPSSYRSMIAADKDEAWRCVVGPSNTVAYRTSTTMCEKEGSVCSGGDTFFGKSVTAEDGSLWLWKESEGLFLPLLYPQTKVPMFEKVCWEYIFDVMVMGRKSPTLSDMSENSIKTGETISALPVSEHPGWLMDADSRLYFPQHHPRSGVLLWRAKPTSCWPDDSSLLRQARDIQQLAGGFSGAKFLHEQVTADRWGVTLGSLESFFTTVEEKYRSGALQNAGRPYDESKFQNDAVGPNMYQVNEQVIVPATADPLLPFPGVSWALRGSPTGARVTHFVTHAWAEGVFEFRRFLMQAWPLNDMNAAAYICFLSIPQNLDIAAMLASIETSPFHVALQNMPAHGCVIMVATENTPIHTRLWCVFEAHMALCRHIPITLVGRPANLATDSSAVVAQFEAQSFEAYAANDADMDFQDAVGGLRPDALDPCCPALKRRREAALAAEEEEWRKSTPEQLRDQLAGFWAMAGCITVSVVILTVWSTTDYVVWTAFKNSGGAALIAAPIPLLCAACYRTCKVNKQIKLLQSAGSGGFIDVQDAQCSSPEGEARIRASIAGQERRINSLLGSLILRQFLGSTTGTATEP